MREVPGSNPIRDIAFLGDKICSTVTHVSGNIYSNEYKITSQKNKKYIYISWTVILNALLDNYVEILNNNRFVTKLWYIQDSNMACYFRFENNRGL